MQTPDSPIDKRIKNLSVSKEGSNPELLDGGSTGSLYSSKDTLSASQSWLRSRAAASLYVPEGSPKSPAPTRDQHASLKRSNAADSSREELSDQSSNQSQVGGSESSVKHTSDERAVTPRGGGIFRINHASAELLSSSMTLSESQRAQQTQTPPPSPAGGDDDADDPAPPLQQALAAVEDPDRETQTLRERARQWAARDSLSAAHVAELEMLLDLAASTFIPRSSIECVRQIDRGIPPPSTPHPPSPNPPAAMPHPADGRSWAPRPASAARSAGRTWDQQARGAGRGGVGWGRSGLGMV